MARTRLSLVVTYASGRQLCRLRLAPWVLSSTLAVLVLLGLAAGLGLQHWQRAVARAPQAAALKAKNSALALVVEELADRVAEARQLFVADQLATSHLYSRSGLGVGLFEETSEAEDTFVTPAPTPLDEACGSLTPSEREDAACLREQAYAALDWGERLGDTAAELTEKWRDAERRLSHTPSIRPARTKWLTSSFGVRNDPLLGHWVMHKGLDLGGPIGTLVLAPADGVVIWTGMRGGYGLLVVLDHGWGMQTHFAHLSRSLVKRDDRVTRGEPIAEIGNSGRSTGPHLHYEVRQDGVPLDPRRFILD